MKRIIVTLIVALMVFGLLPFMPKTARAETDPENSRATIIVNRWHRVGENEYGDPLTDGRTFPWQAAQNGQSATNDETLGGYWGRTDYGMPNSNIAIGANRLPRAARLNSGSTVRPMLWTTVYLTVIANDGSSRPITNEAGDILTLGRWYVVMDEAGQVWFDMDGRFNDSRYTASANPFSPFYEWDLQQTPGAGGGTPTTTGATGRCLTNPRALVDPTEANNTQGPYHFTATLSNGNPNPFYTEPCYFWVKPELTKIVSSESGKNICDAYGGHTLRGESRVWQLGIGSRPDYMAIQRTSPLALYTSDGVVRSGEWDIGLPLIPFSPNDMYAQATTPGFFNPPNPNAVFDPEDDMYRALPAAHPTVLVGDTRLTNVTIGTPPNTITYLAGSTVQPGNADVGRAITTLSGTSFRYSPKNPSPIATKLSFAFRAGSTAITVDDPSKLSPGMTISIGPNANGETEIRTVMSVGLQPSVTWTYYLYTVTWTPSGYYPFGPPPPYPFYYYPSYSSALLPGHLVMVGTEVLQIANVDYWYVDPFGWSFGPWLPAVWFTTTPTTTFQSWGTQLQTLPNVVTLDAPLTLDHARGEGISIMSFAPGDFIYSVSGAAHNTVQVGDIRYADIDDHRSGNVIIGQGAWEDDALIMMEVLFGDPNDPRYQGMVNDSSWQKNAANEGNRTMSTQDTAYGHCMPKFDISMESDFWQGERVWVQDANQQWITEWRGVTPSVTAFAMRSPNTDIRPTALRVAKSTVLDPDGQSFFVHTATAHDLQPDYREYLGVQLFCDNGYDNLASPKNFNGYVRPTALNLSDDYIRATRCEAYLGATDKGVDLDLGRKLTQLDGSADSPKFFRSNPNSTLLVPSGLPPYGCGDVIYFDLNGNNIVDKLDRRATNVTVRRIDPGTGNSVVTNYFAESIVADGDLDVNRPLTRFDLHYKWYDIVHPVSRVPSGKYEFNEDIYWDQTELSAPNGNGFVNGADVRNSDVEIDQTIYRCGDTVGIGDAFYNQYPVKMLSLGKNGNYNYLDMPVLPFPTMDVKVEIDKQLKVEQTSHISVTIEPPPKPGESVFVALRETKINSRQPVPERQIYQQQKNQPMNWIDPVCDGQYGSNLTSMSGYFQYNGGGTTNAPQVALPFTFRFYGVDYTYIYIGMGVIQFGGTSLRESLLNNGNTYYGDISPQLNTNQGRPRIHIANYTQITTNICWGDAIWPPTGETVFVIRWRTRTIYPYSIYYYVGQNNEYELILFANGNILMQFRTLYPNALGYYFYRPYSPGGMAPQFDIGITNADGVNYSEYTPDETLPYTAMSNILFVPVTIPAIPGVPELKLAEDTKWITTDNRTANFEFTPWRGTCLQDGSRSPIEINVYRDIGGDDINVPRNPPPSTYMVAREPSYSMNNPWNGIVIAVNQTFGYEVGDNILIGTNTNIERRKIVQIHYGRSGQTTRMAYNSPASLTNNPTYIIPVLDVTDMLVGNPLVIGDAAQQTQESHIITSTYTAPDPRTAIRIQTVDVNSGSPTNSAIGTNKIIQLTEDPLTYGWAVGQFIGLGNSSIYEWAPITVTNTSHWWNQPAAANQTRDTVKIIEINPPGFPNSIRVANLHVQVGWNWYGIQQTGIEVRDPIKFAHGPITAANEPVYTTQYAFTLDRGLDFNHIFGDPVVGIAYFDAYWTDHKWDLFDLDRYPSRSFADLLPPDPISPDLDNGYDCYWRGRFNIDPEEIIIKPELKKCLSTLDQRYPNVLVSLWDADNPNDVNDPANIPISAPAGFSGADRTIIANVNATGAGVAWLATVRGFITQNGDQTATHRYILQVNTDGSYEWWRWYEPIGATTQIVGALDPNDWLYRWLNDDPDQVIQPPVRTPLYQWDNAYEQQLSDNDCSVGKGVCDPCNKDNMWPCLGDVSFRDSYGRFMGIITDTLSNYPNPNQLPGTVPVYGRIETFGIPVAVERWQQYSTASASPNDGGQIMFPVHPRQQGSLTIRVYLYDAIFDYNSTNIHTPGPYFTSDTSYGIDYCGYYTYDVPAPDASINFIEMRTIDHALQNSQLNYTTGVNPLYSMRPPAPRIQAAYYPILNDYKIQFRSYPGGQSHPGRLTGVANRYWFGSGWNAYPAIWHKQFVKLGTEFFPLTDYGIYFILTNALGNHLGFSKNPSTEPDLLINYIRVTGPFMTPRYYNPETLNCILGGRTTPFYQYNNVRGLPIGYDYSGEILVDAYNWPVYHSAGGGDFSNVVNPLSIDGYTYTYANSWLSKWKDLYYSGFWQTRTTHPNTNNRDTPQPVGVNIFDELIPIGPGKISIEVELADGTKKIYEDCCEAKTSGLMREIPVHGLKIDGLPLNVTVDSDNVFEIKLTEDTGKGMIKENGEWLNVECNDALLFAWQDRGIIDGSTKLRIGALDGRITNPPYSSKLGEVEFQFEKTYDLDGDNKISYKSMETEVLGTYDLVTNTWQGGYIDARTFQRENGMYKFELTDAFGCRVDTVGVDVGGVDRNGRPLARNIVDHIIDDTEVCPIIITAYKYGDDNTDRAFTPLYDEVTRTNWSHEVYLAGQQQVAVEPMRDLSVTYGPEPLTAGVVSELVGDPLTFTIKNYNNEPVDLSKGIPDSGGKNEVLDEAIWRNLFKDPHPDNFYYYGREAKLPQYYWIRTDLHNIEDEVGRRISNTNQYNTTFMPILPDFTKKADGKYTFKGFIANDKGQFETYIYTPDRKHSAVISVKVASPKVKYEIINMEDQEQTFQVPGDPDFVMTAGDNRIYKITVQCSNAQDALLKGIAKSVSVCSGLGKDTARFTPAVIPPLNWYYGDGYRLYLGVDINGDGKLTNLSYNQTEYNDFYTPVRSPRYPGNMMYNTYNMRYSDYTYEYSVNYGGYWYPGMQTDKLIFRGYGQGIPQLTTPMRAFGLASHYNEIYDGTYLFADLTPDGSLTFQDSLSLDQNARTTFFVYATGVTSLTGLIGNNEYCNSLSYGDVAINPLLWGSQRWQPNYLRYRYQATAVLNNRPANSSSNSYFSFLLNPNNPPPRTERLALDWEAFADRKAEIGAPKVAILDPSTGEEWGKAVSDPELYDLIYAVPNHMLLRVYPADPKDLPIHEGNTIELVNTEDDRSLPGNQHEFHVLGKLTQSPEDKNLRETNVYTIPTATGKKYASFMMRALYKNSVNQMEFPWFQSVSHLVSMDVIKGMAIEAEVAESLKVNRTAKLKLKVTVSGGSTEPVSDAKIKIEGVVDAQTGTTNQKGEVEFQVNPKQVGKIKVVATHDKLGKAFGAVGVETEIAPPMIIIEPISSITNKTEVTIKGKTNPGNTVKIGGQPVKVADDGSFTFNYKLTNEGYNQFDVEAITQAGLMASQTIIITRDTIAPTIICDQEDPTFKFKAGTTIRLTGRVEPYSKVVINGVEATVVYDNWTAEIPNTGASPLVLKFEVTDMAGNKGGRDITLELWKTDTIIVSDGDPNVIVNGNPLTPLPLSPYVNAGFFMVPVDLFTQVFGQPQAIGADNKVTLTIGDVTYELTDDKAEVTFGGATYALPAKVVNRNGIRFVEATSFAQLLGLDFDWNQVTKVLTLWRLYK